MNKYERFYNASTSKKLARAKDIDAHIKYQEPYSLYNIVHAMRELFKGQNFRNTFAKNDDKNWTLGMCALSSIAVKVLGGEKYQIMAISPKDWDLGPLIFIKIFNDDKPFNVIDEKSIFGENRIPYELAFPLDSEKIKTANKDEFIKNVLNKIKELNND